MGRLGNLLGDDMSEHARVIVAWTASTGSRRNDFSEPFGLVLVLILSISLRELDEHFLVVWIILNFVIFASPRTTTLFQ